MNGRRYVRAIASGAMLYRFADQLLVSNVDADGMHWNFVTGIMPANVYRIREVDVWLQEHNSRGNNNTPEIRLSFLPLNLTHSHRCRSFFFFTFIIITS